MEIVFVKVLNSGHLLNSNSFLEIIVEICWIGIVFISFLVDNELNNFRETDKSCSKFVLFNWISFLIQYSNKSKLGEALFVAKFEK